MGSLSLNDGLSKQVYLKAIAATIALCFSSGCAFHVSQSDGREHFIGLARLEMAITEGESGSSVASARTVPGLLLAVGPRESGLAIGISKEQRMQMLSEEEMTRVEAAEWRGLRLGHEWGIGYGTMNTGVSAQCQVRANTILGAAASRRLKGLSIGYRQTLMTTIYSGSYVMTLDVPESDWAGSNLLRATLKEEVE